MIKIEALTLEDAFKDAAIQLNCSITEINIEVVQAPTNGILGMFRKKAIIVAAKKQSVKEEITQETLEDTSDIDVSDKDENLVKKDEVKIEQKVQEIEKEESLEPQNILNDTIMPQSFVNDQDEDIGDALDYTADYDDEFDEKDFDIEKIAHEVEIEVNKLFKSICFELDEIKVKIYDTSTLLIEFQGKDAALLIGKEGYRYKALSYMLFNWINAKYNVNLRLEIAEFLKNQEESVTRYLDSVYESIDRDGRAQTKILDGVLIQIALKELRDRYPDKYVVIRSTRDGLKYIIINDYHN